MNKAQFVRFSNTGDLNRMPTGQEFTVTWRVRNTGTTTWVDGYKVVHIHTETGSTLMAGQAVYDLAQVASQATVAPGAEVDITLTMTAPAAANRRYFSDWQLQDLQGNLFGDIIWFRVVTIPAPVKQEASLKKNSQFVDDHTIPDGTPIEAGKSFLKQWVVRNTGEQAWGSGYHLVFVSGDTGMSGTFSHPVPAAEPGDEVVISVDMVAPPSRQAVYMSSWRIHDENNVPFGDNLWVKIFSTASIDGFDIRPFSQNDPTWKHQRLGFGPRTFGEFGCLLTCYTMMLNAFGENLTPLDLNNRFLGLPAGRGFSGSDVFFAAPEVAFSHVQFLGNFKPYSETGATFAQHDPNLLGRMAQAMARGEAVIAQVDTDPSDPYTLATEQHWVLIVARQGDDYLVLDPFVGQAISLLGRYGQSGTGEKALRDAIKSVLFYRSSQAKMPTADGGPSETAVQPTADDEVPAASDGQSRIGPAETDLVYTGPAWKFGRCLMGIHDRANRHPQKADHDIVRGRFESVKVMSGVSVEEMQAYEADFYLCRLFESWNGRHVSVADFVRAVVPDMARLVDAGVEYFELHNEPNMTHEGLHAHGVQGSWANGAEFAQYFIQARQLLQQRFPGIKVGFPGLSPGGDAPYQFGHDSGFRMNDSAFLEGAVAGIRAADFVCLHAYYLDMDEVAGAAIDLVKSYRRRFPDKLLFVTEFSNPDPEKKVAVADKGRQAKEFYRLCKEIPGLGAAYYFIVSGSGWDNQALRRDSDGRSTGMIEAMFA